MFLLPVVLSATRLCEGDDCNARYARIAAGDITERNTRPFQVRNSLINKLYYSRLITTLLLYSIKPRVQTPLVMYTVPSYQPNRASVTIM